MKLAFIVLIAVAAVAARSLAKQRPDHRPIARLMAVALAGEIAQWAIEVAAIAPLRAELGTSTPWTGWARVAGHVADAVWLAWPAAVAGTALRVFAKRSATPALIGWSLTVTLLVIAHPVADGSLSQALTAAQAVAAAVSVGLGVAWFRRRSQQIAPGQREEAVSPGQVVLAVIVANEVVFPFAAWCVGAHNSWDVMQVGALLTWSVVAALQWRRFPWVTQFSPSSP